VNGIAERILRDAAVTRTEASVFLALFDRLDYREFRAVKAIALATELSASNSAVSAALRALVEHGYLVRGARDGAGGPWTYRIPLSKRTPTAPTPRSSRDASRARSYNDSDLQRALPATPTHC
jgi:hypothetical protein